MGGSVRDPSALEALFERHARDVLAYAMRRTDAQTAEEVVGEVFTIAWRKQASVPAEEPVLWLYAVARRVLSNERRAARRRASLHRALADLPAPVLDLAASEGGLEVWSALAALRPVDREALLLTTWEGLDGRSAAIVLGCSIKALHTRLHRARRRLAEELVRQREIGAGELTPNPELCPERGN